MRKSVCIVSFSPIARDARVLRQVEYLSQHYDVVVIGYGEPDPLWRNVRWLPVVRPSSAVDTLSGVALLSLARVNQGLYERWFWRKGHRMQALRLAALSDCDVYHANDWEALPVAAEAARRNDAKLVFDAHEYSPLQHEHRAYWRVWYKPAIEYLIRRYGPKADVSITVAEPIAHRYRVEYKLNPVVILNVPKLAGDNSATKHVDPGKIRLVHHGGAIRDRHLELMIETIALADERFSLHFILVENDRGYMQSLKGLAERVAPGRVCFEMPVKPREVVGRISEYDMGLYILQPRNFNQLVALPNKFFDFIAAGLAVLVGPSPSMAAVIERYGCGLVVPTFDPSEVASALNRLTLDELARMRTASRRAAGDLNADREMPKLLSLYDQLLMG